MPSCWKVGTSSYLLKRIAEALFASETRRSEGIDGFPYEQLGLKNDETMWFVERPSSVFRIRMPHHLIVDWEVPCTKR